MMRDDFTEETKRILAQRVGYRCSNPICRILTSGPRIDSTKVLNIGVAAHITAASEGGPRFDSKLSPDQRKHPENGIWVCQNCSKLVDNDTEAYPADYLRSWKRQAEALTVLEIGKKVNIQSDEELTSEELEILSSAAEKGDIHLMGPYQIGYFVRADRRDFIDPADPAYAAQYVDALERLISKGLIRHIKGVWHQLTGAGFKIGRIVQQRLGDVNTDHAKDVLSEIDPIQTELLQELAKADGKELSVTEFTYRIDKPKLILGKALAELCGLGLIKTGEGWKGSQVYWLTPVGRDFAIEKGYI